jgi:hypothetical protein
MCLYQFDRHVIKNKKSLKMTWISPCPLMGSNIPRIGIYPSRWQHWHWRPSHTQTHVKRPRSRCGEARGTGAVDSLAVARAGGGYPRWVASSPWSSSNKWWSDALLGVAQGGFDGLQPLVPQNDVVSEIRDHEEPGAGISDIADDNVHVDHPQGARGLVLCCQLQVDVAFGSPVISFCRQ